MFSTNERKVSRGAPALLMALLLALVSVGSVANAQPAADLGGVTEINSMTVFLGEDPPDASFTVANNGTNGRLNYEITDNAVWLFLDPTDGGLNEGQSDSIEVDFVTDGLIPGTYMATISVFSDDGETSGTEDIDVMMTLVQRPELSVSLVGLDTDLGTHFEGATGPSGTYEEALRIANIGGGILEYEITEGASWLAFNPTSGLVPAGPGAAVDVTVDTTGLRPGTYTAVVTIGDPVAGSRVIIGPAINSPQTLTFEVEILERPAIFLTSDFFQRKLIEGDTIDGNSFLIVNMGGEDLEYSISILDGPSWDRSGEPEYIPFVDRIELSRTSGVVSGYENDAGTRGNGEALGYDRVEIYYDAEGITEGTYNARLRISDPDASNSPQDIDIEVIVLPKVRYCEDWPGFASEVPIGTGMNPEGLAAGDLNGDEFDDLVSANALGDSVTVAIGTRDGFFEYPMSIPTGFGSYDVAIADFNDDGYNDMAVVNTFSQDVTILTGYGNGSFQLDNVFSVGNAPEGIVAGDFDHDGYPDLAIANDEDDNVTILINNFNYDKIPSLDPVSFFNMGTYPVGDNPTDIQVGDFNWDGDYDLVTVNIRSDDVSVLWGNGDGTFSSPSNYPAGSNPSAVTVGDFDGDHYDDFAVVSPVEERFFVYHYIYYGGGGGGFEGADVYDLGINPTGIVAGDFNGDGYDDLAISEASPSNPGFFAYLNNGGGYDLNTAVRGFSFDSFYTSSGVQPADLIVGDFNGDCATDVALGDDPSDSVGIYYNDCYWTPCTMPGDVNGDMEVTFLDLGLLEEYTGIILPIEELGESMDPTIEDLARCHDFDRDGDLDEDDLENLRAFLEGEVPDLRPVLNNFLLNLEVNDRRESLPISGGEAGTEQVGIAVGEIDESVEGLLFDDWFVQNLEQHSGHEVMGLNASRFGIRFIVPDLEPGEYQVSAVTRHFRSRPVIFVIEPSEDPSVEPLEPVVDNGGTRDGINVDDSLGTVRGGRLGADSRQR